MEHMKDKSNMADGGCVAKCSIVNNLKISISWSVFEDEISSLGIP